MKLIFKIIRIFAIVYAALFAVFYFDLDGRGRHFLAVRRYEEAIDRTANPQNYKD